MVARGVADPGRAYNTASLGAGPWWVCGLGRGVAWRGRIRSGCAGLARAFPLPEAAVSLGVSIGRSCSHPQSALHGSVSGRGPGSCSSTEGAGPLLGRWTRASVIVSLSLFLQPRVHLTYSDMAQVNRAPATRAIATLSKGSRAGDETAFGVSWSTLFPSVVWLCALSLTS